MRRRVTTKDQPTLVEMLVDGDLVEVFFDSRCCLMSRLPENATGSLALLTRDGAVAFERIQIRRPSPLGQ
jgi:hypothetical protein